VELSPTDDVMRTLEVVGKNIDLAG